MLAAAPAAPPFGAQHAVAVAAPATAGARAALTLRLTYPMVCGNPGAGSVVARLPTAPGRLARTAVLVDGKPPPSIGFLGRTVTIRLPKPPQVLCQSIGQGTLTIRFTRAAGLVNPARAGSYTIPARVGNRTFAPRLAIR